MARKYTYGSHFGGITITRLADGKVVLIPAGDDAAEFWAAINSTYARYTDDDVCAEYFTD